MLEQQSSHHPVACLRHDDISGEKIIEQSAIKNATLEKLMQAFVNKTDKI